MADTNFNILVGTKLNDTIQKQLDTSVKKTVTVKAILDTTGLKTLGTTELTKYEDGLGNVVVASKKFDASGKELNSTIKSVKSTVDTTSQTLQTASKHTKTLGQDFIDTAGKVAKFGAITAIFGLVTTAIGTAVKSVKDLDSAMVEFNKVSNLSGSGLDNYTKKLGELGLEVARTKEDMIEASTEFVKAGYTEEESAKLAKTASLFQNIADTELSASQASTVLISNMKAFGMTSDDSEKVADVINEISNVFAVSSSDISAGLSKTASAMSTLGNTYEQSIALMVGAGEQMPNQSGKIARGLRSVGLEIVKTAKQTKELDTGYGDVTLSLYDQNDALKSTFDIMSELYPTWQKMTNEQKSNLGISLAGKQQYEVFSATMEGFDQVLKANEVGLNAMGSAMKENEAYMGGIEAKTKLLKAQFDLLVNGDGGINSFIKGVLDAGTAILKFANSDIGQSIIQITALLSVVQLLSLAIKALGVVSKVTAMFQLFSNTMLASVSGVSALNVALGTLSINPVVIGITALIAVIYIANKAIKEQKALIEELEQSTKSLNGELVGLKAIEAPNQAELDRISYLEKRIELEKQLLEARKKQGEYQAQPEGVSNYAYGGASTNGGMSYGANTSSSTSIATPQIDTVESEISAYTKLRTEIDGYNDSSVKGLQILEEKQSKSSEYLTSLEAQRDKLDALQESQGYLSGREEEYLNVLKATIGEHQKSAEEMTSYADIVEAFGEDSDEAKEYLEGLNNEVKESTSTFSDIQSAYDTLVSAMDEYNESGVYSLDTVSKLLALDSEYAGALQIVNGQMTINEEAIRNKVLAQAEEAKQTIYNTAIEKLNALASAESGEASALAGDDHSSATSGINAETDALGANTTAKLQNAIADAKGRGAGTEEINQVLGEMSSQLALVNKATLNMGVSFEGSMGKASKSTSKASAETDKLQSSVESLLKEHLEDKIDDLKKAEESEVKVLEDRITILEKNRDTQLDSIDSQIDGIEKLQDAEESQIDNEISQLEKQKSAVESYYDAQISALEKANTERERQIKLMELEEALSKAKATKVMVMTDTGWQAKEDESAVSSAEQNLSDYQGELTYTTQIEQLEALKASAVANIDSQIAKWEEYKTTMQNNYASQISALETYRTTIEQSYATQIETLEGNIEIIQEQYDLQIEQLEVFKDNVDMFVENLSSAEQTRLANQLNTMKATASNYQTDLENLKEYVNKFNSILAVKGSAGATVSTGTSVGSSTANSQKTRGYASGVASVSSNEIAMIGDSPSNRELVIGSKLNGTATMLSQGSGVVNAQSTKSLAGILNTLGSSMGLNGQTMGMNTTNQSNATSQSIQIANITLPSVTNGQGLLDELRGFASGMLQTAYSNG